MRISELPKYERELALIRQQEEKDENLFSKTEDDLEEAFYWRGTQEGNDYWELLHKAEARKIQPKNYDDVITIIETKIQIMTSRGFESYFLPIGILKDLIREIKEIK